MCGALTSSLERFIDQSVGIQPLNKGYISTFCYLKVLETEELIFLISTKIRQEKLQRRWTVLGGTVKEFVCRNNIILIYATQNFWRNYRQMGLDNFVSQSDGCLILKPHQLLLQIRESVYYEHQSNGINSETLPRTPKQKQ